MSSLNDTLERLMALRTPAALAGGTGESRLAKFADFGTNPGNLAGHVHLPSGIQPGAALVVVLHGCTQTAAAYDQGSGWSQLADENGFAVLFPEQQRANNANLCFNWFEPSDTGRDRGEALSIRQMVSVMIERHRIDPARVFVTGLSAGGAMTSALLAAYPDVFAGGAIIAGLAAGAAQSMPEALQAMRSAPAKLIKVKPIPDYNGPWPTVSVWHGDADHVVNKANAAAIVNQWRDVHHCSDDPVSATTVDGQSRHIWTDKSGRVVIESWTITAMGHGTPLTTAGPDALGAAGPHMLEAGISSTRHITRFWGLERAVARSKSTPTRSRLERLPEPAAPAKPAGIASGFASGPGKIIEDALRAAGLLK